LTIDRPSDQPINRPSNNRPINQPINQCAQLIRMQAIQPKDRWNRIS